MKEFIEKAKDLIVAGEGCSATRLCKETAYKHLGEKQIKSYRCGHSEKYSWCAEVILEEGLQPHKSCAHTEEEAVLNVFMYLNDRECLS